MSVREEGREELSLPSRLSFETLKKIIRGWYQAGAHLEEKTPGDVHNKTKIVEKIIARNNRFLVYLGILQKTGRRRYRLTDAGETLSSALDHQQEEKAKRETLLLCRQNEFFQTLWNHSKTPRARDELVNQAASIGRVPSTSEKRMIGVRCVVDMAIWCGLVVKSNDKYVAAEQVPAQKPAPEVKKEFVEEKAEQTLDVSRPAIAGFPPVVLAISHDTPPERVKEIVIAAYEGYDEYLKRKEEKK